jgi:PAS domain S-box-containing protein
MRDAVLVTDVDGVVTHANAAASRLVAPLGIAPVGARLTTLLPGIHDATLAGGTPVTVALAGATGAYELTATADATGATIVLRDVTADAAERAHLRRLAEIVEATPDFVGIATPDGRTTYLNAAARTMLGHGTGPLPPELRAGSARPPWARARFYDESLPAAVRRGTWTGESALLDPAGTEIPVSQVLVAHRAPDGTVDAVSGILRDLRAQKAAEATLRASERLHRTVVREIPGGAVALLDRTLRIVLCDGGALQAIGADGATYVGRALDEFAAPPVTDVLLPAVRRVLAGEAVTFQFVVAGRTLEMRGVPITDDAGPPTHALLLGIDVTAREAARTAVEASEQRLQDAIDLVTDGIYEWDVVADRVRGSSKLATLLGYAGTGSAATVEGWFALVHPEDVATARGQLARHLAGELPVFEVEYRVRAASGEWRWVADRARVVERDADGRPIRLLGANADITERKRAEAALRAIAATAGAAGSDGALFGALASSLAEVLELRAACIAECDAARPERLHVLGAWAGEARTASGAVDLALPTIDALRAGTAIDVPAITAALCGAPGTSPTVHALRDAEGTLLGVLAIAADAALGDTGAAGSLLATVAARAAGELARRRADARLREREAELAEAQRLGRIGGFTWHPPSGAAMWSDETCRIFGMPPGTTVSGGTFFGAVHPDDLPRLEEGVARVFAARATRWHEEYRIRHAGDGRERWLASQAEITYDDAGAPVFVRGVHVDITERHGLEARLRQSQKLEAVGQLAGGLAHDFNNLLTVVRGHARFLLDALPAGRARRDADAIRVASERAAGLTRQLLMLSRREVSAPRRIAPDRVIAGYAELLDRILGDHVVLELALHAGERPVLLDPVHLEQVLLNLALNARDAMADEGTLRIATAVVAPTAIDVAIDAPRGAVRLSVHDSGAGMDAATAARAFEPFFTTKPPGRGTGIGLATVLGIVEQAGGHVWLESVPGAGTTVELLFPVADGVADAPEHTVAGGAHAPDAPVRVLLAEDEADVRAIVRRTLEDAGCEVLACEHGVDALARWLDEASAGRRIDALVSDLRMPRMNGRDLARALRAEAPTLPVLLVSGFDDAALGSDESWLGGPFRFVAKPFGPETLTATLAALLRDGATTRATADGVGDASGHP